VGQDEVAGVGLGLAQPGVGLEVSGGDGDGLEIHRERRKTGVKCGRKDREVP